MNNFYYQQSPVPMGYGYAANGLQISYVNGLIGAKAYSVPPNTTIFLMDSDAPYFYVKTSDRNGMCSIKTYEFKEVVDTPSTPPSPAIDMSKFITREELDAKLASALEQFAAKIEPSKHTMPLL